MKYQEVSCNDLVLEHEKLVDAYRAIAKRQITAANTEVAGVLLIAGPLSGSNDVAYEVARLKG